jgi:hypothetical protein
MDFHGLWLDRYPSSMKLPLVSLALAALGAGLTGGCGSAGKSQDSTSRATAAVAAPGANRSVSTAVDPDHDDHITEAYGHAASATEKMAVSAVLRRYYTVAVAGDGVQACGMISSSLARSIPKDYGQPPGPPALRGKTCSVVMSKFFAQQHRLLVAETPTMNVTRVRVKSNSALAFLAFATTPEPRDIGLERSGDTWKVTSLLDNSLP